MFFKQSWSISTYYIWDKMMCDIVDNGVNYESWIYHADYGVKLFMIGKDKKETNIDDFIQLVRSNMDEYILLYKNEYFFNNID